MRETFFLVRRRIHCYFEIEEVHLRLLERFSFGSFFFVAAAASNHPSLLLTLTDHMRMQCREV